MRRLHTKNGNLSVWLSCAILGGGSSIAFGQGGLPVQIESPDASPTFGQRVATGEDLTLDGLPDVVVLDPEWLNGQGEMVGALYAYRGYDGLFLWNFEGLGDAGLTTRATTNLIGDVNGDGVADIFVGMPNAAPAGMAKAGQLDIRSGLNGSLLYQIFGTEPEDLLGRDIEPVGDINDDDVPDFAAITRFQEDGALTFFSGLDGAMIRSIAVTWPNQIANVGDVTGDENAELLISEWSPDDGGLGALLVSAIDGAEQRHFFEPGLRAYGYRVGGGGDLDGDNVPDLLVGNLDSSDSFVYAYSGVDGNFLQRVTLDRYGMPCDVAIGDVDGEGINEILVGQIAFYDVFRFGAATPFRHYYGSSIDGAIRGRETALADLNGDGRTDFVFGVSGFPRVRFGAGSGIIFGNLNYRWDRVSIQPPYLRRGSSKLYNSYGVAGATPGERVWALYSFKGNDCTFVSRWGLCIDLTQRIHLLASGEADARGEVDFSFPIPWQAPLDLRIWFQAVQLKHDVFGPVVSNVMEAVVVLK